MATKTNVVHGTDGEDIMSGTAGEDEWVYVRIVLD